jgi:small subunit ribosomal protein S8
MAIDSIGDFLTIIRNATMITKPSAIAPHSKMKFAIAKILKEQGFIRDVIVDEDSNGRKHIKILLKYVDGESVIHELKRMSKPSRRFYLGVNNVKPVIGGLGISILSTDRGLLDHKQAGKLGVGGEIICTVW